MRGGSVARIVRIEPARVAKSGAKGRRIVRNRHTPKTRVRVVRSRSTGAHRSKRSLAAPESISERQFLLSLERSLKEYRTVWEALAKR